MSKYKEYKKLDFPAFEEEVLQFWKEHQIFEKSVSNREGKESFVFYEGPPSANGMPGIHHVMARTVKDIFCRYQTLNGKKVNRKAGWDTHGLPIELQVEKTLGITKEDIGKKISVADYNEACRKDVLKFKDVWDKLTDRMGYWVDLSDPYITYDNNYIESLWWLLKQLYDKKLLYKGYTIQPYSPAAGTGLSSHELNQQGTYRDVKDSTVVVQFKVLRDGVSSFLFDEIPNQIDVCFLAWTTTPWTLPSNIALAVGKGFAYKRILTYNKFTGERVVVILAASLIDKVLDKVYYRQDEAIKDLEPFDAKKIPYIILPDPKNVEMIGENLKDVSYLPAFHFERINPDGWPHKTHKVIVGGFVTTDDGTGIVHIAPNHGAEDRDAALKSSVSLDFHVLRGNTFKEILNQKHPVVNDIEFLQARLGEIINGTVESEEVRKFASESILNVKLSSKITETDWTEFVSSITNEQNKEVCRVIEDRYNRRRQIPLILVDKTGKFIPEIGEVDIRIKSQVIKYQLGGKYVKEAYLNDEEKEIEFKEQKELFNSVFEKGLEKYLSVDDIIILYLKGNGVVFETKKYEHTYPHCWRTDKPILYYPLESWFIKTTAAKDRLVELNKTINWKPEHTGSGRFGNWLENLVDWNLSRSRYWGTPLPIWVPMWRFSDEEFVMPVNPAKAQCVGSVEELLNNGYDFGVRFVEFFDKVKERDPESISVLASFIKDKHGADKNRLIEGVINEYTIAGKASLEWFWSVDLFEIDFWKTEVSEKLKPSSKIELHKPYVDDIYLIIDDRLYKREPDLIDVWFDSGAMPYAQWHWPFENEETFRKNFPADYIAEGVDQTRGWFFTLHAISVLLFDSIAYKNVIANGLVLDKNGNKMSKRLGNVVDPFEAISKYGADANRWYMMSNSDPWDNLKFDIEGVAEVQRKFFGTLYNTYSFFALYANLDGFAYKEADVPHDKKPEIDRWVLSLLNTLVVKVRTCMDDYDPTPAVRAIADFVNEHLSNWYVRLCRKRFWRGEYTEDKISAYQTLYTCLETVAQLMSPHAPFYADQLFRDLNAVSGRFKVESVHLSDLPVANISIIDKELEEQMDYAQKISSLVLSIRKKEEIRVRQPLQKILIPVVEARIKNEIEHVKDLILSEVNVKELEYMESMQKSIKANFKVLGKKAGPKMKTLAALITGLNQEQIAKIEQTGELEIQVDGVPFILVTEDVEILSADIPGYKVANEGKITVALDITLTSELKQEGIAREVVNRLQNLRKEMGLDVTDRIAVEIKNNEKLNDAINLYKTYICSQILAEVFTLVNQLDGGVSIEVEDVVTDVKLSKLA